MTVCIAGKNEIATGCVEWLLAEKLVSPEHLLVCFNRNDSGEDGFQRSFRKYCRAQGLTEARLADLYSIEDLVFFSLEFDRIIRPDRFASDRLFNVHFSLLPSYKGMYTSAWPILNGESTSGVTLHEIDAGIDTGDIVDQLEFPIEDDDDCRSLYFKYTAHGLSIFRDNYQRIVEGRYTAHPQSPIGSSYFAKSSIDYGNVQIDLNKTAYEIRNQIRAFNFREFQVPVVHGARIVAAHILDSSSNEKPGAVLSATDRSIDVATIDYDLRLIREGSD